MAVRKATGKQWFSGLSGYVDIPERDGRKFIAPKRGKAPKHASRIVKCLRCNVGDVVKRAENIPNETPAQRRVGNRSNKGYTYANYDDTVFCSAKCGEEYCKEALDTYFCKLEVVNNEPKSGTSSVDLQSHVRHMNPMKAVARGA